MHIPDFLPNLVYGAEYGIIDCIYCLTIFRVAVGVWDFVFSLFLSSYNGIHYIILSSYYCNIIKLFHSFYV